MILHSASVELIRTNASRLEAAIRSKDDLADLATAANFEQAFSAMETILTNTDMFFDDEFLCRLDETNWRSFKAVLIVYTLNSLNRRMGQKEVWSQRQVDADMARSYGASSHP